MPTIEKRKGDGIVTFRARVRIKGFPEQQKTFRRKTDAQMWAQQTETAIRKGEFKNVVKSAAQNTLAIVIERYREEILPAKSPGTRRSETAHLKFWEKELGKYALAYIEPELIRRKLRTLAQEEIGGLKGSNRGANLRKRSKRTIKYYRHTLHLLFKHAGKWGWIATNPVEDVEDVTNLRNGVERYLDDDERQRLLEAAETSGKAHLYPIIILALTTGARKGEILGLTLDDVHIDRRLAVLRNTKNGETRSVPLVKQVIKLIERQIEEATEFYRGMPDTPALRYLFPNKFGTAPVEINRAWYKLLEDAEVKDFRFHDLRHSTASYLAMNGASLIEIADILGHKTLQMVKRYAHLSADHKRNLTEKMSDQIL